MLWPLEEPQPTPRTAGSSSSFKSWSGVSLPPDATVQTPPSPPQQVEGEPRDDVQQLVEHPGRRAASSVCGETNDLVAGAEQKRDAAEDYGARDAALRGRVDRRRDVAKPGDDTRGPFWRKDPFALCTLAPEGHRYSTRFV